MYSKYRVRIAIVAERDRPVTAEDVPPGTPMQGGQMVTEIQKETIRTIGCNDEGELHALEGTVLLSVLDALDDIEMRARPVKGRKKPKVEQLPD